MPGYRAYRIQLQRQPHMSRSQKLLWMLPMLLAIVAMPLELYVLMPAIAPRPANLTHCTSYGLLSMSLLLQRPDRLPFCST